MTSADDKCTIWDFSVEVDETQKDADFNANDIDIPPQLMFLHQGQKNMKELRFHPQYANTLVTTAEDSFNVFRPNFDPDSDVEDSDEGAMAIDSESKDGTALESIMEESKTSNEGNLPKAGTDHYRDSDSESEDEEEEERRAREIAKQLNKQRRSRSNAKAKSNKNKRARN